MEKIYEAVHYDPETGRCLAVVTSTGGNLLRLYAPWTLTPITDDEVRINLQAFYVVDGKLTRKEIING